MQNYDDEIIVDSEMNSFAMVATEVQQQLNVLGDKFKDVEWGKLAIIGGSHAAFEGLLLAAGGLDGKVGLFYDLAKQINDTVPSIKIEDSEIVLVTAFLALSTRLWYTIVTNKQFDSVHNSVPRVVQEAAVAMVDDANIEGLEMNVPNLGSEQKPLAVLFNDIVSRLRVLGPQGEPSPALLDDDLAD